MTWCYRCKRIKLPVSMSRHCWNSQVKYEQPLAMLGAVERCDFLLNRLLISTVFLFLLPYLVQREIEHINVLAQPGRRHGLGNHSYSPVDDVPQQDLLNLRLATFWKWHQLDTPPPYLGGRLSVLGCQLLHRGVFQSARRRGPLHHAEDF